MTNLGAIWSFLQGAEAYRRRAADRLTGSPFMVRLTYLGGHPGIWNPEEFWVGRVQDRLRLVDQRGERCYDLPLERICGLTCNEAGHVEVQFEPTAGLLATVAFAAGENGSESYHQLVQMMMEKG